MDSVRSISIRAAVVAIALAPAIAAAAPKRSFVESTREVASFAVDALDALTGLND